GSRSRSRPEFLERFGGDGRSGRRRPGPALGRRLEGNPARGEGTRPAGGRMPGGDPRRWRHAARFPDGALGGDRGGFSGRGRALTLVRRGWWRSGVALGPGSWRGRPAAGAPAVVARRRDVAIGRPPLRRHRTVA